MNLAEPFISVIIPCFNHAHFIADAISSVQPNNYPQFEIIVIDDGSTDDTEPVVSSFRGVKYFYQENQGLAAARNYGVAKASGKYILPLDSDNKIVPEVFIEAAKIMGTRDEVDVVYTDGWYFGEKEGEWKVGAFDGYDLLYANYIDACALIRKTTLIEAGLYDGRLPAMGNEDWELWLRFFLQNRKFVYFPKAGFHYRVVSNSMSATTTNPSYLANKNYVYHKHAHPISEKMLELNRRRKKLDKQICRLNNLSLRDRFKIICKLLLNQPVTK